MKLVIYLGKIVYITLANGYYYSGKVIDATEEDITIIDKNNKTVSLSRDVIISIREVGC